jgi:hypothetical protein
MFYVFSNALCNGRSLINSEPLSFHVEHLRYFSESHMLIYVEMNKLMSYCKLGITGNVVISKEFGK